MKKLITRIRNINRRQLAVSLILLAVFCPISWGLARLVSLLAEHNSNGSIQSAANFGYVMGLIVAVYLGDLIRWAKRIIEARLPRQSAPTTN